MRFYGATMEAGWCLDARIDHADPARQPLPKPDVRSMLRGVGPVVVFGSSNFPFAYSVAGGDTASALAAGCPVIVKAHPAHPGTSELVGAVIAAAVAAQGLPGGLFSPLFDGGHGVGAALVRHAGVKAVGFTGSLKGGRALMDLAAARREPIPVFAEMGSVNPVFILPGAMAAQAAGLAAGLHASATLGVGQFCTNPGLVVVRHGPEADVFAAELAARMSATAAGVMLTPGIAAGYRRGVVKLAGAPGVKTLAQAPASADGCLAGAAVMTVNADQFIANPALREEVFGPSTLIICCRDLDQMGAVAGAMEGQLTATLHGTEAELAGAAGLLAALEGFAGRVVCNGFPTGVEVCHAMVHGGPYPASSDGRTTSVGTRAALRFLRPVCFQGLPDALLPDELKESNLLGIPRLVDGVLE
ncbi:MAG: aldehyde dehydrogenase (NADP(+)) [Kiritimatiellia bacterium]